MVSHHLLIHILYLYIHFQASLLGRRVHVPDATWILGFTSLLSWKTWVGGSLFLHHWYVWHRLDCGLVQTTMPCQPLQ